MVPYDVKLASLSNGKPHGAFAWYTFQKLCDKLHCYGEQDFVMSQRALVDKISVPGERQQPLDCSCVL